MLSPEWKRCSDVPKEFERNDVIHSYKRHLLGRMDIMTEFQSDYYLFTDKNKIYSEDISSTSVIWIQWYKLVMHIAQYTYTCDLECRVWKAHELSTKNCRCIRVDSKNQYMYDSFRVNEYSYICKHRTYFPKLLMLFLINNWSFLFFLKFSRMKNPLWFIIWLLILVFITFFIAAFCAGWYILIYPLTICLPPLSVSMLCIRIFEMYISSGLARRNHTSMHSMHSFCFLYS